MSEQRIIKNRSIIMVYILSIITLGFYGIYWIISTKRDINSLGADIPNCLLMFIPVVHIFWVYKYSEGYSCYVKKDNQPLLWTAISLFIGFVLPFFVQKSLNEYANASQNAPANVEAA